MNLQSHNRLFSSESYRIYRIDPTESSKQIDYHHTTNLIPHFHPDYDHADNMIKIPKKPPETQITGIIYRISLRLPSHGFEIGEIGVVNKHRLHRARRLVALMGMGPDDMHDLRRKTNLLGQTGA